MLEARGVVSLPHWTSSAPACLPSSIPSSWDLHASEDGEFTFIHGDPS